MANTLTNTLNTLLAQNALNAFTAALTPLRAFSTNFSEAEVSRGDKVKVLWLNAAAAAQDFSDPGTYTIQDSTAEGLDITINKRKYVSWHLTTEQMANNPQVNLERFARQKGFQLAKAVIQDIFSLVTNANYGAASFTGGAASFDNDDVADLEVVCDDADWPEMERGLILKPTYHGNLVKDAAVAGIMGVASSPVISSSRIDTLHNFDIYKSTLIPDNSENLVGMAVHPDAILMAMRVLRPEPNTALDDFQVFTDPGTGMSITLRQWYEPTTDQTNRVLECNYGRRTGNTAALKRLVSA